ncbi:AmmeMemoRadiSam system radical SAM enzyme [Candidatus Omnitrophota bacterium]
MRSTSFKIIPGLALFFALISLSIFLPGFFAQEKLKEAYFYQKLDNKIVNCRLCPKLCVIRPGKRGFCRVRENRDGILYTLVYAKPCAIHIDPIEKKPLFHFLPARPAFSIATAGCNLKCVFCQNWQISQATPEEVNYTYLEPEDLIRKVEESGTPVIAYTYTEPVIFYEYMVDTAKLARARGIKNVMHSAGQINEEPLRQLCEYLDAANIDLKGFSEKYYNKMSLGSLDSVLRTLKILKEEGVWLEITNLVLPGYNDDEETLIKMCLWIKDNLGNEVPLHFSRFYPTYKLLTLNPTPLATLERARRIALDCGLKYVYIGNIPGHEAESTYCPSCGKAVIKRSGYSILEVNLDEYGKCKFCQQGIAGIWK